MNDPSPHFVAALVFLGMIIGFLLTVIADDVFSTHMYEYPGLSDRLSEQLDDCEARPNVLTCEWNEDKVDYVPKEQAND